MLLTHFKDYYQKHRESALSLFSQSLNLIVKDFTKFKPTYYLKANPYSNVIPFVCYSKGFSAERLEALLKNKETFYEILNRANIRLVFYLMRILEYDTFEIANFLVKFYFLGRNQRLKIEFDLYLKVLALLRRYYKNLFYPKVKYPYSFLIKTPHKLKCPKSEKKEKNIQNSYKRKNSICS